MFSRLNIIKYLSLNQIGLLELLIAFYPILAGYSYGILHGNMLFIFIGAVFAFFKHKQGNLDLKVLKWLIIYFCIHEVILLTTIPLTSYFINNSISILLICLCIFPISKAINYKKFVGSLNWVAIISIGGMVYHFLLLQRGEFISPIKLPLMPSMGEDTRLYSEVLRPTSFYWEPASFATFMMVPLFISLIQKKYLWSACITLSMFLSTSSTGILMSILMITIYSLTQRINLFSRILIITVGLCLIYLLLNSQFFEAGVTKIEETEVEENPRMMNGIILISALNFYEYLFGIAAANIDEFYAMGRINDIYAPKPENIFVPSFYLTLAKYGILGLILFLSVFLVNIKRNIKLLPYISVIIVSMFFQSVGIGTSGFAFQLIYIYSFIIYQNKIKKNGITKEDIYFDNSICK